MLALWVLLVSHYPHASWGKKETMNFLIPERICKSQLWLRNVWRLKSLIHLHSKMKKSIKHTLASRYLPQRMVYNPIPSPIYSKRVSLVPVPCKPDGGGILEAPETLPAASAKCRCCSLPKYLCHGSHLASRVVLPPSQTVQNQCGSMDDLLWYWERENTLPISTGLPPWTGVSSIAWTACFTAWD